jgi:presenilin-like A22 family membrane protease
VLTVSEESSDETIPESVGIPMVWVLPEDQRVLLANQFLVQEDEGTFFVTMGQVAPPVLLGTPEERYEQARSLGVIPVTVLGRYAVTRANVGRLIGVLEQVASTFDARDSKEDA